MVKEVIIQVCGDFFNKKTPKLTLEYPTNIIGIPCYKKGIVVLNLN